MRLSELIAHGERLAGVVRDLRRGANAAGTDDDWVLRDGHVAIVQALERRNAKLQREATGLRMQAKRDRHEIVALKDRAGSAERRTEAHRETIAKYYTQLQAELRNHGKTASANTDGE